MIKAEPSASGKETAATPKISVIIPTYRPDARLGDCIASVVDSGREMDLEVWIVDSSEEDIQPLIMDFLDDVHVHLEKNPHRLFPGEARDLGVRSSRGDVLVFTDSDCVADKNWLPLLARALIESGCDACGGSIENGTPGSYFGTAEYLSEFGSFSPRNISRRERFVPTCNMAIYRSAYLEAGGFLHDREKGSDVAFGKRLNDLGKGVYFTSGAVVTHYNRTAWRDFMSNQYHLGQGFAANIMTGNQPFSWVDDTALTRYIFLASILPARLYRIVRRTFVNTEVALLQLLGYLPALALGAASFALGCFSRFLTRSRQGPMASECVGHEAVTHPPSQEPAKPYGAALHKRRHPRLGMWFL